VGVQSLRTGRVYQCVCVLDRNAPASNAFTSWAEKKSDLCCSMRRLSRDNKYCRRAAIQLTMANSDTGSDRESGGFKVILVQLV
jgi:hypothetical protein